MPSAVGVDEVELPSVRLSEQYREWLAEHDRTAVYVMPGAQSAESGVPTLVVPVTEAEYFDVLTATG